jgi:hypothetical protein
MAVQTFVAGSGTAEHRRFFIFLVDETDGKTPELGEAGGQPQISKNGGSFANTGGTLVSVGNGCYYVELTAIELNTAGHIIVRYKSAETLEFQDVGLVQQLDLFGTLLKRIHDDVEWIRWNLPKDAEAQPDAATEPGA